MLTIISHHYESNRENLFYYNKITDYLLAKNLNVIKLTKELHIFILQINKTSTFAGLFGIFYKD